MIRVFGGLKRLLGLNTVSEPKPDDQQNILPEFLIDTNSISLANPISQPCTASQIEGETYRRWCERLKLQPFHNRKVWEFCYILQALEQAGLLASGYRGLGFGVGKEPLPSVMAATGCQVLATDLDDEQAKSAGWKETDAHAGALDDLLWPELVDKEKFRGLVQHQSCDMNDITDSLRGFDFCWSCCAFEHLGNIQKGIAFVESSLRTLKPGGLAVHTTEFNCTSNTETVSEGGTVLFRRRDIEEIARRLRESGHSIQTSFFVGNTEIDHHIDAPPYRLDKNLKIALGMYVTTSYGLIIRKSSQAAER